MKSFGAHIGILLAVVILFVGCAAEAPTPAPPRQIGSIAISDWQDVLDVTIFDTTEPAITAWMNWKAKRVFEQERMDDLAATIDSIARARAGKWGQLPTLKDYQAAALFISLSPNCPDVRHSEWEEYRPFIVKDASTSALVYALNGRMFKDEVLLLSVEQLEEYVGTHTLPEYVQLQARLERPIQPQ